MKSTLEDLKAATAQHVSQSAAERIGAAFKALHTDADPNELSLTDAAALVAVGLASGDCREAASELAGLRLTHVTVHIPEQGEGVVSPAEIDNHEALSAWVEHDFVSALRGPIWAGVQEARGERSAVTPMWSRVELIEHEGRIIAGVVSLVFPDGVAAAHYGAAVPSLRLVSRRCVGGDALFSVGHRIAGQTADLAGWVSEHLASGASSNPGSVPEPPTNTLQ